MATRKAVNAARRQHSRKPKLGQNFLHDDHAARWIVEALGEIGNATVIEIGPGRGALTLALARRAGNLIAVELDEMLAAELRSSFADQPNVVVSQANILHANLANLLKATGRAKAKVVGNIPYYITSDILLHLFAQHESVELIVIMVQREVADRLAAQPGSRDYGLLTVTAQLYADIERLFTLAPESFSPPPQVHSSVLRLRVAPKSQQLGVDERGFLAFAKLAFAQKRKTLVNNMRQRYPEAAVRSALNAAEIREDVRAEALSVEQLAQVYRRLSGMKA
jgi:16S rRNA (adenine1518-N6/adenine1519-N6)-dimethyltransferase